MADMDALLAAAERQESAKHNLLILLALTVADLVRETNFMRADDIIDLVGELKAASVPLPGEDAAE